MRKYIFSLMVGILFLPFFPATTKAQASCETAEIYCSIFTKPCDPPCIRVITKENVRETEGYVDLCQCQLPENTPASVQVGKPCQQDSDCAWPAKYCWGNPNQQPTCQENSRFSLPVVKEQNSGELCGQGQGIDTAIGCIPISSESGFLGFFLRWAIGIGGGIAFLLLVYSGFMMMTSTGNPEKLQAGKELMVSAISGLIMLIFSVFILRVIGVDILGIIK